MSRIWKLSPSELTFLWDECPRCFYLKVVHGFNRPWGAFPKIFTRIDNLMKDYFEGKSSKELTDLLPEGVVRFADQWVTSSRISVPGHDGTCFIRGKFDTVVEFSDGSYGVVDFKTTIPRAEHVGFYSRQLHAYAYALENPAPGSFTLSPISWLGLLCVEPGLMDRSHSGQLALIGNVTWLEIPIDVGGFLAFVNRILDLLEQPDLPDPGPNCEYCQYRDAARRTGF